MGIQCEYCQSELIFLEHGGGCGGVGDIWGCKSCNVVFEQENGGIIPPHEIRLRLMRWVKMDEFMKENGIEL